MIGSRRLDQEDKINISSGSLEQEDWIKKIGSRRLDQEYQFKKIGSRRSDYKDHIVKIGPINILLSS